MVGEDGGDGAPTCTDYDTTGIIIDGFGSGFGVGASRLFGDEVSQRKSRCQTTGVTAVGSGERWRPTRTQW